MQIISEERVPDDLHPLILTFLVCDGGWVYCPSIQNTMEMKKIFTADNR